MECRSNTAQAFVGDLFGNVDVVFCVLKKVSLQNRIVVFLNSYLISLLDSPVTQNTDFCADLYTKQDIADDITGNIAVNTDLSNADHPPIPQYTILLQRQTMLVSHVVLF